MQHPAIIVLDTNFALIPGQLGVDIYREFERICTQPYTLWVVAQTIDELRAIQTQGNTKEAKAARVALALFENNHVKVAQISASSADDAIVAYAKQNSCMVATQDRELKEKLVSIQVRLIVLRQQKYLVMV